MTNRDELAGTFDAASLKNTHVLLVDDEPDTLSSLQACLEFSGFSHVRTAANGKAALEVLSHEHIDVVVSDYNMPVMDGLAMVRAIRSHEDAQHHLPVIIVSGNGDIIAELAKDSGVDVVLKKPPDIEEVIGQITRLAQPAQPKYDDGPECPPSLQSNMQEPH